MVLRRENWFFMRDALFQQFATVIHQQFGIQLPMDKKALLESRLFKLLNNNVGFTYSITIEGDTNA